MKFFKYIFYKTNDAQHELVLKPNKKYLIRITNLATANTINVNIGWLEAC